MLELGGEKGYMKYRTVPVFPQVGDKINRAIEAIATRQMDAPAALKQAEAQSDQEAIKMGGYKIDPECYPPLPHRSSPRPASPACTASAGGS